MSVLIAPPAAVVRRFLAERGVHVGGQIERTWAALDGTTCLAMACLSGRDGEAVELSLAGDGKAPLTRAQWRHIVDEALTGATALVVRTRVENGRIRQAAHLMGGAEVIIPDRRGEGRDEALSVITRRAWRHSRLGRR